MILLDLEELDPKVKQDQEFLYEIIKYRWSKHNIINVTYKNSSEIPTFEQHITYLNSGKYKKLYKVLLGEIAIGSTYIDNNNFLGMFILPTYLKIALKKYKNEDIDFKINNKHIGSIIFKLTCDKNKDIKKFYGSGNPDNTLSLNIAKDLNLKLVEVTYEYIND